VERAELQFVMRVVSDGGIRPWRALTELRFAAARRAFARQGRLSRGETATLLVALIDLPTRDRCWLQVESHPDPGWPAFWRYLSRRAPRPYRVEPLFLLAWSAWRLGELPVALAAAEATAAEDPHHRGAVMLRSLLVAGLEPDLVPSLAAGRLAPAGER
jgi:hypothetical protein